MEQHLILLLFYTGFVPPVLSVPRKFYLIKQEKNWSECQAYCRAEHTDLAIIKNNEDLIRLQDEAHRQLFSSSAWIGLSVNVSSWRWSMGNEPLGSMRFWKIGEPNNLGGLQECVSIFSLGWMDKTCTELLPSVCFNDRYTGNQRFIYIPKIMTWYEAQAYCRQNHTDLTSSRDTTEDSVVRGLTSGLTWTGLFRDSWKWTDQTSFSSLSWMTEQPDNDLKNENCAYINNSQVADSRCSTLKPFFCYREVTGQQQTLRVKVKSSEDVNDPAVKAAISEQISQKLKEKGMMRNFTVKWREHSDASVFHKVKEEKVEF